MYTVLYRSKFTDKMMSSRSGRAETRQSRKEDIKRVMHNVDKVITYIMIFRLDLIQIYAGIYIVHFDNSPPPLF